MGRTATPTRKKSAAAATGGAAAKKARPSKTQPADAKNGKTAKKPVAASSKRGTQKPLPEAVPAPAGPRIDSYPAALAFLSAQVNYERRLPNRRQPALFTLDSIRQLLAALDNPHLKFRSAHVAGTKGKGSTAAMLAGMLQANGLRVGVYSSPHLLDVRERITVNGEMISQDELTQQLSRVAAVLDRGVAPPPTYFDILTATAFAYFADRKVDIAVVEVGLGGRLDSTNVITPDVCGITSISFDHTAELGNTLREIAIEKAGIFKEGVPIISAPQLKEVRQTLKSEAAARSAPLFFAGDDIPFTYRFESSRSAGPQARICVTTPTCHFDHLAVPLVGQHQALNCGVALGMLDQLKQRGLPIDQEAAVAGLARVRLPGRMDMLCTDPRVLVDGAHNAASVEALMRAIGQNVSYDSMVVIFGCCADKDVAGMLKVLCLGADKVIFTGVRSPRSADPAELSKRFSEESGRMAQFAPTLTEALEVATMAVTREDLICVTGSFYLVAEAMRFFANHPHRAESTLTAAL